MGLAEDIASIGRMIDAYSSVQSPELMQGVVVRDREDRGVPPDMQVGNVSEDGWVGWRVLPSKLTEADVGALEREFGVEFPPPFRAYLLARSHLFDQVRSRRYDQQVFMPAVPSRRPFRWLRDEMRGWEPLIAAGYVPFAEWGDAWGPMCFDTRRRGTDGDCPVVWMDHELLARLGPDRCQSRADVEPLAQPLYGSFREMLPDVFSLP